MMRSGAVLAIAAGGGQLRDSGGEGWLRRVVRRIEGGLSVQAEVVEVEVGLLFELLAEGFDVLLGLSDRGEGELIVDLALLWLLMGLL